MPKKVIFIFPVSSTSKTKCIVKKEYKKKLKWYDNTCKR